MFVNSARMRRRLKQAFVDAGPLLLPKIALVSDLVPLVPEANIAPPLPSLDRQLEMARLIEPLLSGAQAPAPRSAVFDLADSLIALLDEMHTEGVSPDSLLNLDVEGEARHWQQSQAFLEIVQTYLSATDQTGQDPAARERSALSALLKTWDASAPETPVLVVGSTGSRGTTFELMQAVSKLPQGAVVLPAFDDQLPQSVWETLTQQDTQHEDHPQYRFAAFLKSLELKPHDVEVWPALVPDVARNALISLALRPAPVTNEWLACGPDLGDLTTATKNLTLLAAANPREEANAIAVRMRVAINTGQTVALVTPDRTLSRRISAALQRWSIVPDDSGGMPLALTPPGRLLRQLVRMLGSPVEPAALIALLRHPLVRSGGSDRGEHILWVNELDLSLRKVGLPSVAPEFVTKQGKSDVTHATWCAWVASLIERISEADCQQLGDFCARHVEIVEALARGAEDGGAGGLWDLDAGTSALAVMDELGATGTADTAMSVGTYARLLESRLNKENVRPRETGRSDAIILGALEARVQGSDVLILGGLNESVWPSDASADPWLSRSMRREAGLLSPERQIGLSAHDFQHAVGAKEVILSRAVRNEEAETVPSRWLNRLMNLLSGLPEQNGHVALADMQRRGSGFIAAANQLDAPKQQIDPAPRPAPAPPSSVRPKKLSVTVVEKLIRDPYWIYARYILKLNPLRPIAPEPSAALRGTVFHKIMERFVMNARDDERLLTEQAFIQICRDVVDELVPWPSTRRLWLGHLVAIAPNFVSDELERRKKGKNLKTEVAGSLPLLGSDFVITGEADRIDEAPGCGLFIYDYKSGTVPTPKQTKQFNPQILIESVMANQGAFDGIPATEVLSGSYISLSRAGKHTDIPMSVFVITGRGAPPEEIDFSTQTTEEHLKSLLMAYAQSSRGYVSRRAMEKVRFEGDFDHLARFGEWDETQEPLRVELS